MTCFQDYLNNSFLGKKFDLSKNNLLEKFIEYDFIGNHINDIFNKSNEVDYSKKYKKVIDDFKKNKYNQYIVIKNFIKKNNL